MAHTFSLRIDQIQLSQLYISSAKLADVMSAFENKLEGSLGPIPIKEIDGKLVATDGHTRLLAWHLHGYEEVDCEWEDTEMDWEAYRVCMQWCREEGIQTVADLNNRIISPEDYKVLWLDRCRVMQHALEMKNHRNNVQ
ncbi:MAG: hypothetical protein C4K48_03410 [Candidatus Thorarchaeota archaeon]|nr:MAG: hypothetical protein C4K48_03410 [Candidatus Thorarchaeota archaeon]